LHQSKDVYVQSEFCKSHPGEAKQHGETIELSGLAINLDMTTLGPIYLSLNAGFCFISIYGRNFDLRSHFSDKVLDYSILACESFLLDLTINT